VAEDRGSPSGSRGGLWSSVTPCNRSNAFLPSNEMWYSTVRYCRAHYCQAKCRRFIPRLRRVFSLHPTYLQLWALWVLGEVSWGRSITGEESQEGQMKSSPSLNVLVQSAKSGRHRTVKTLYPLLSAFRNTQYITISLSFRYRQATRQNSSEGCVLKNALLLMGALDFDRLHF